MTGGIVGLYGLFLLFVGIRGNGDKLINLIRQDGKPFTVWIIAILILFAVYTNQKTSKLAGAFLFLILLAFFLSKYSTMADEINKISGQNLFP